MESDDSVSDIIRAAASFLGYAEIRLLQESAVRAFVTGSRDVFLSISTGGNRTYLTVANIKANESRSQCV